MSRFITCLALKRAAATAAEAVATFRRLGNSVAVMVIHLVIHGNSGHAEYRVGNHGD
jgi:hypothetical protein